jgi:hypothetical protein
MNGKIFFKRTSMEIRTWYKIQKLELKRETAAATTAKIQKKNNKFYVEI